PATHSAGLPSHPPDTGHPCGRDDGEWSFVTDLAARSAATHGPRWFLATSTTRARGWFDTLHATRPATDGDGSGGDAELRWDDSRRIERHVPGRPSPRSTGLDRHTGVTGSATALGDTRDTDDTGDTASPRRTPATVDVSAKPRPAHAHTAAPRPAAGHDAWTRWAVWARTACTAPHATRGATWLRPVAAPGQSAPPGAALQPTDTRFGTARPGPTGTASGTTRDRPERFSSRCPWWFSAPASDHGTILTATGRRSTAASGRRPGRQRSVPRSAHRSRPT